MCLCIAVYLKETDVCIRMQKSRRPHIGIWLRTCTMHALAQIMKSYLFPRNVTSASKNFYLAFHFFFSFFFSHTRICLYARLLATFLRPFHQQHKLSDYLPHSLHPFRIHHRPLHHLDLSRDSTRSAASSNLYHHRPDAPILPVSGQPA